ncbi:HD domain-containing protein, partial [Candidatus Bathyarchaeota archaeon]
MVRQQAENIVPDPLSPQQAEDLLDLVDVIRDPIHGDVRLTALERHLIDSPEFQRLRGINQLGMTYVAYPGAVHNRFMHSIGTLHVCSQMLTTCNANADTYRRLAGAGDPLPIGLSSYAMLLARLCALLHDLAHVPFGHTFEKEGRIFRNDEWQDPERRDTRLLGSETEFAERLRRFFTSNELPAAAADRLREDLKAIFVSRRSTVDDLPYPFIHDLVGNTICADLIDYVERDMYFCGLSERFGDRFLEYLAVMPVIRVAAESYRPIRDERPLAFRSEETDGARRLCRVVLLRYRYNERKEAVIKHGVVSEAIDLVRKRLSVAEKLYFHRTKMIASSMLISAAAARRLTATEIWDLTDAEVLKLLAASTEPRAQVLARKLQARDLFKPIYRVTYRPGQETRDPLWDEDGAYERFKTPRARENLSLRLEEIIAAFHGQEPAAAVGTVTMSCPDRDMNLKAFDMLVLPRPGGQVRRLHDSEHPPTKQEIQAIVEAHQYLWKLEVFVDSSVVNLAPQDPFAQKLAGAIQHEIGPKNEIEAFANVASIDLDTWAAEITLERDLKLLGLHDKVTHADFGVLKETAFREMTAE